MMKTKTKLKLKNISKTATKTKTLKKVKTKITLQASHTEQVMYGHYEYVIERSTFHTNGGNGKFHTIGQ